MSERLNFFQATMLRWRELHPYNAVHVVRLTGTLDAARLTGAVRRFLQERGLTGLVLDRAAGRYEWRGGASTAAVHVLDGTAGGDRALHAEIERQLNLAYPADGPSEPFRFFALDEGSSFWLGVAYDHFVAGGDSIAGLLRGIADSYAGVPTEALAGVRLYPPAYRRLVVRQAAAFVAGLARLRGLAAACKRSLRPRYSRDADGRTAFASFRLGDDEAAAISRAAAAVGVTPNDIFLAILLKSLARLAPARPPGDQRRELGVASIVNIRRDFGRGSPPSLGPVLASFRFSHPVPEGVTLRELIVTVNAATARIKRDKLYLQSLVALALVSLQWRFLSLDRRYRFFAKHYPVWAGTTPVNVSVAWKGAMGGDACPDYIRAVPTGPLAPISLAVTTSGSTVHVGVSFRTAAFDAAAIAVLIAEIRQNIALLPS